MAIKKEKTAGKTAKASNKNGADKNCASANKERMPRELEFRDDESCHKRFPSSEAMEMLVYNIADWVDVGTFLHVVDVMRMLDDELALKVATYVGVFCFGGGRSLTGLDVLDNHLLGIYKRIYERAKATGHKLEIPCPF